MSPVKMSPALEFQKMAEQVQTFMWSNPSRAGATKETAHVPSSAINLV